MIWRSLILILLVAASNVAPAAAQSLDCIGAEDKAQSEQRGLWAGECTLP